MKRQAIFVCGALVLIGGCVVVKPGVLDAGGEESDGGPDEGAAPDLGDEGNEAESDETGMDEPDPDPYPGPSDGDGCAGALDILVVLDNSGSAAPYLRRFVDAFPILIDGLDQAGVDWRLAVTTTDNSSGNSWCSPEANVPEAGRFVFSPCTSRLDEFVFGGVNDMRDVGCNDVCSLDAEQLEALPTITDLDAMAKPRPWLQRENGQLNVAAAADDAIRCLLPMGVNGCGFEEQLESMRLGLASTTDSQAPEYGFLRDDASLLIVLVTDEADGSFRPEHKPSVYDKDGDKVFWSDLDSPVPTSAISWNAGVECFGDPDGYDDCVAVNKGQDGDPTQASDAVMYPVSRYQDVLAQIETYKRAQPGGEGADVAVLAVTGVELDGTVTHADVTNTNPGFQTSFGIGPGCVDTIDPEAAAIPPVRVREVAEHLSTQPLASICAASFDQYMIDTLERFVGGC